MSTSYQPQNNEIYDGLKYAYLKYGTNIYNMKLFQLNYEFGGNLFPKWISRFQFELPKDKNYQNNCELWKITESFCGGQGQKYLGEKVAFEKYLTTSETKYFLDFAKALEYKTNDWSNDFKLIG